MTNLPVPVPATVAPGTLITSALFNAQVCNAIAFLLNPPAFQGYSATAQSIANNAWLAVTMDTNRLDTYGAHSTTTNPSRFVAPVAGLYYVDAQVSWAGNATGIRGAALAKNGTAINGTESLMAGNANGGFTQEASGIVQCAAGDYIELWAYQNSGAALSTSVTTGQSQSGLAAYWIHA